MRHAEIVLPEGTHDLGIFPDSGIRYRIFGRQVQMQGGDCWSISDSFHDYETPNLHLRGWVAAKIADIATAHGVDRDLGICPMNSAKYRVRDGVVEASQNDRPWIKSTLFYDKTRTNPLVMSAVAWIKEQMAIPFQATPAPIMDANISILRHAITQALHSLKDPTIYAGQAAMEAKQILLDALEDAE